MNTNFILPLLDLGGVWHITMFVGLSITVLKFLSFLPYPRSVKCLAGYVLVWALFIQEYPAPHFGPFTASYQATAGQVFAELIFIPLAAVLFYSLIKKILPFAALYSCACVWFHWDGLLSAPSFHSAFAALAIPFLPPWAALPVIFTVLDHHGTTAILILGSNLLIMMIRKRRVIRKATWLVFPVMAAAAYSQSGKLFDGGERLQHYAEYMRFWSKEWRWIVLGVGPGSFVWTSALLDKLKAPLFVQMHSDFLQIAFELGLVGWGLTAWVFYDATKRAWKNTNIFSGLIGCAVFSLTYYPLRFFPTALLVAFIFASAFSYRLGSSEVRRPSPLKH